jgi:hypothetical protein
MCWHRSETLGVGVSASRIARRFTSETLTSVLGEGVGAVNAAEMIASELVSNAVNARASTMTLTLAVHRTHVRIGLTDDAEGSPTLRTTRPDDDPHGRGLAIVAALATQWGVRSEWQPLKEVWADVPIPHGAALVAFDCVHDRNARHPRQ